jgi:hypothetical protein
VTITQSPAAGTVLTGTGSRTITLTATDDAGKTSTCSFNITLVDDIAPVFTTCPSPSNVFVNASCSYTVASFIGAAAATDNCDTNVTITQSPAAGTVLTGTGSRTITLTATDDAGKTATCAFNITLVDDVAPVFTTCPAPSNVLVNTSCSYTVANFTGGAVASDNCDSNVTIAQSPVAGTVLTGTGSRTITLTATDDAGKTATCSFNITLVDDIAPVFTTCPSPSNVLVNSACSYTVTSFIGGAAATDNCDSNVTITQSPAAGTVLTGTGPRLITLTATDDAGKTSTCSFNITLVDDIAPVFTTCPAPSNVLVGASCSYTVTSFIGGAAATDNCDSNVTITQSPAVGTVLTGTGSRAITLTATDDAGKTATCSFNITLIDDTAPVFTTCPSPANVLVNASCAYTVTSFIGTATATDNCDSNVTITQSPAAGTVLTGTGSRTITLTATDDAGKTSTCSFNIMLVDDIAPVFTSCPAPSNVFVNASCSYTVTSFIGGAAATDNCDSNVTITQSPAAGTVLTGSGSRTITLTATDDGGKTSTCSFDITLVDNIAPVFTSCPSPSNVFVNASCSYAVANFIGGAAATDNCDSNVTITQSPAAGTVLTGTGSRTITLTATDDAGKTATCSFNITLVDDIAPVFTTCPSPSNVLVNASCSYTVAKLIGGAAATDN